MKKLIEETSLKLYPVKYEDPINEEGWDLNEDYRQTWVAGVEFAQKEENSKLINYIERKYGIVINRVDLDNFLNREI